MWTCFPLFCAVCEYSPAAPPEAGAVLDVRPRKQMWAPTLLGEERRAVLQQPHLFLCQGNTREGSGGDTGRWHGTCEWRTHTFKKNVICMIENNQETSRFKHPWQGMRLSWQQFSYLCNLNTKKIFCCCFFLLLFFLGGWWWWGDFQGKTLTTIALILTNFHKGKPLPVEKCVSGAQERARS